MAAPAFFTRHPLVNKLLLPVAFVIAFALFLLWTFPYDTLARRIEVEAGRSGAELSIGALGPSGLFGVRAREVKVHFLPASGGDALPDLHFERLDLSPDLFALLLRRTSFGFAFRGYGGSARGHAALSSDPKQPGLSSLRLEARNLELQTLPLKELAGVEAAGKLQLKADLTSLVPAETSAGTVTLLVENGMLTSGRVQGFPLPKTMLGKVDGNLLVDKGVARFERTLARGGDIDADLDGNLSLRPLLTLSQADLHLRFRISEKWLNQNELIKSTIGIIQNARQGDGSYLFSFSGPIAGMTPRPGR